jgi:hypothetical protein
MDQIHLSPLVDQIQLALGHISNTCVSLQLYVLQTSAFPENVAMFLAYVSVNN